MIDAVIIMGPSGTGKSTLASALAQALDWTFVEGDSLHPPSNIAKMRAGRPLSDEDRIPFLRNVAERLAHDRGRSVAACSALKRKYRDQIRDIAGDVLFVLPTLSREDLVARMTTRSDHFMPTTLIDSQLADLEPPGADEHAVQIDGSLTLSEQLEQLFVLGGIRGP